MKELIKQQVIDNIINKYNSTITSETTQQEMLQIIGKVIYESINSIDTKITSSIAISALANEVKNQGKW